MLTRLRGLPLQLFVLIVLPLTMLLLVIAFGSLALHQRAMRDLVGERDQRAVQSAAGSITEQLHHRASAVRSLALQATNNDSPEQTLADAAFLAPDFEGGLALYSTDGNLLIATSPDDLWRSPSLKEYLLETRGNNESLEETQFLQAFQGPNPEDTTLFAISRVHSGLTAVGAFEPSSLARRALADVFSPGDAASAFVVNADGLILYQTGIPPWSTSELPEHPGVAEALRGESGTTYLAVEGEEHVIAFSSVPLMNWALVIEEPWRTVADPLLRTTEFAPLLLAPALVITMLVLWFGVRQIVQPLQSLQQKATELAWGDFSTIEDPVGGIAEIDRLQQELIHMASKVQAAQQSLRGYLGAVTIGQEEERRRLARELHDDTLQSLIALNQRLQMAQLAPNDHAVAEKLEEAQQMTTGLIADLRRFTHNLRPTYLEDLGLVTALDMLVRDTGISLGIQAEFHAAGRQRRLLPEVELALYRMVQEALNNIARHAYASQVTVQMAFTGDEVRLEVTDDGSGFVVPESPAEMAPAGHYGLLGLYERSVLIGGQLSIQSELDHGTSVSITVPL